MAEHRVVRYRRGRRPTRRRTLPLTRRGRATGRLRDLAIFLALLALLALGAQWATGPQKPDIEQSGVAYTPPAEPPAAASVPKSSWLASSAPVAEDASAEVSYQGRPYVIDGDTLRLGGVRIRVMGIDAPEMSTPEGRWARRHLIDLVGQGEVACSDTGQRSYDRVVGVCALAGGEDVGAQMVADGWAVDLPRFSGGRYAAMQAAAERAPLGMYSSR